MTLRLARPALRLPRKANLVLIDQALISGANFVTGLLLARFLGAEGYGQFILGNSVILFLSGIQLALTISPLLVLGAEQRARRNASYFQAVIAQQLLFVSISALLAIALVALTRHLVPGWRSADLLWPIVFAWCGFALQDFFRRLLFVHDRHVLAFASDFASHGLKLLVLAALGVMLGLRADQVFWVIGVTCALGCVLVLVRYKGARAWRSSGLQQVNKQHWDFGKWLIANALVYWCSTQLIMYMAGAMISVAAVGSITAALNIVGAANILFLALENFVPSEAARAHAAQGRRGLDSYLCSVAVWGGAATLAIAAIAAIWAEFWLALMYGSGYAGSGWIIVWWSVFYVLGFLQRPLSVGLRVVGDTRAIFCAGAVGASVALLVSYPAIRTAGIAGAMLSLCLVQASVLIAMAILYRRGGKGASTAASPTQTATFL
jgi:O-antigen/teichoic acid export membrane protein